MSLVDLVLEQGCMVLLKKLLGSQSLVLHILTGTRYSRGPAGLEYMYLIRDTCSCTSTVAFVTRKVAFVTERSHLLPGTAVHVPYSCTAGIY